MSRHRPTVCPVNQEAADRTGDAGGASESLVQNELLLEWRAVELESGGFARVFGDGDAPSRAGLAPNR